MLRPPLVFRSVSFSLASLASLLAPSYAFLLRVGALVREGHVQRRVLATHQKFSQGRRPVPRGLDLPGDPRRLCRRRPPRVRRPRVSRPRVRRPLGALTRVQHGLGAARHHLRLPQHQRRGVSRHDGGREAGVGTAEAPAAAPPSAPSAHLTEQPLDFLHQLQDHRLTEQDVDPRVQDGVDGGHADGQQVFIQPGALLRLVSGQLVLKDPQLRAKREKTGGQWRSVCFHPSGLTRTSSRRVLPCLLNISLHGWHRVVKSK